MTINVDDDIIIHAFCPSKNYVVVHVVVNVSNLKLKLLGMLQKI
jgi:hypothetical protein